MFNRHWVSANIIGLLASLLIVGVSVQLSANSPSSGAPAESKRVRPAQATEPSPSLEPGAMRLSGRLIDPSNGSLIAGASVKVSGCDGFLAWATSSPNGKYAVDVPAASLARSAGYTVSVDAQGYLPEQDSVDASYLQNGMVFDFRLWLASAPPPTPTGHTHYRFSIKVRGQVPEGTPIPLEGAKFVNLHCRCYEFPQLVTGPDGQADRYISDPDLPCGAIRYRISAVGYERLEGVESGGAQWQRSFVLKRVITPAPARLHLPRLSAER